MESKSKVFGLILGIIGGAGLFLLVNRNRINETLVVYNTSSSTQQRNAVILASPFTGSMLKH
jgi:hypothetical protein